MKGGQLSRSGSGMRFRAVTTLSGVPVDRRTPPPRLTRER